MGITKGFVFWVAGTALVLLCLSIGGSTSSVPDMASTRHEGDMAAMTMTGSRKLKEIGHTSSDDRSNAGSVNLEDYEPIDPVPSSMTSIKPGPIQHGTPLMPYIPQPSPPPEHPKQAGFP